MHVHVLVTGGPPVSLGVLSYFILKVVFLPDRVHHNRAASVQGAHFKAYVLAHDMTQQPPFALGGPKSSIKLLASLPSAYRVIGNTGGRL